MASERWRTLPDGRQVRNVPHAKTEYAGDEAVSAKYEDMKNEELTEELERRGLPKSGNKEELIERLEEDDAA